MIHLQKKNKYSTAITGAGFLLHEFREIVALKLDGLTDNEIKRRIIEKNVLQYNTTSALKRSVPYLLKRIDQLDNKLLRLVLEEDIRTVKLINLYSIMRADRLFYEFMTEVVAYKLRNRDLLQTKDLNVFFRIKTEQSSFLAGIAQSTEIRLKNQYFRILYEAGILKDRKNGELTQPILDEELKNHFAKRGDHDFLYVLGEG